MKVTTLSRLLVYVRRATEALERMAPPAHRPLRRTEFSLATDADFERGYAMRNVEELESQEMLR